MGIFNGITVGYDISTFMTNTEQIREIYEKWWYENEDCGSPKPCRLCKIDCENDWIKHKEFIDEALQLQRESLLEEAHVFLSNRHPNNSVLSDFRKWIDQNFKSLKENK